MLLAPSNSDRLTIIGRTGTGKTVDGLYWLSRYDLKKMRWIMINMKNDEKLNAVAAREMVLDDPIPVSAGVYTVRPLRRQKKEIDAFFSRVWEAGETGILSDETMLIDSDSFDDIMIQGRTREIPVIAHTQRGVYVSRFALSEATYFQLHPLNDDEDWTRVLQFAKLPSIPVFRTPHHSVYYNATTQEHEILAPVPPWETSVAIINEALSRKAMVV